MGVLEETFVMFQSAPESAAFPRFKEFSKHDTVRLVRAQLDRINARRTKHSQKVALRLGLTLGEDRTLACITRADFDNLAGLGIFEHQPPEGRQFQFTRISDLDRHHIVPAIGLAKHGERRLRERFKQHQLRTQAALTVATRSRR